MGWLDRLGRGLQKAGGDSSRSLESLRDLIVGDMVKFDFTSQAEISGKTFSVDALWTLSLGENTVDQLHYAGLVDGAQQVRVRSISADEFEVAISVLPQEVLSVFKEKELAEMLESDDDYLYLLHRRKKAPDLYLSWTAALYRQEAFRMAYRFDGGFRETPLPDAVDSGEIACDYYRLVSDDRKHAIEIRVFDGGRTEVHFCIMLSMRKVEEMWPIQQE
ncbi:MAG: hypothetical protein HN382_09000 [Gammaproteobacteria bacterium]|nr:hypothetical protein [Gammaproteobacteria bacterium]